MNRYFQESSIQTNEQLAKIIESLEVSKDEAGKESEEPTANQTEKLVSQLNPKLLSSEHY